MFEEVEEYMYVEQAVRGDPNHDREIRPRIGMGSTTFGELKILKCKLALSFKRRVSQCILPVMTSGAEPWRLTKQVENKSRSAERPAERIRIEVALRDRTQAYCIWKQTRVDDIIVQINKEVDLDWLCE